MTEKAEPIVTPEIARWTLNYFGAGGVDGGYFFTSLMTCIAHASGKNLVKLYNEFPVEIYAFKLAKRADGINILRVMASLPMLDIVK